MAGNCEHITLKPVNRLKWLKTIKVCVLCDKRTIRPGKKMYKCVDCKKYLHKRCTKAAKTQETAEDEVLDVCPVAECAADVVTGVDIAEFENSGVKNSQAQTCDSVSVDISTLDCKKYEHNRCLKKVVVSEISVTVGDQLVHVQEYNNYGVVSVQSLINITRSRAIHLARKEKREKTNRYNEFFPR